MLCASLGRGHGRVRPVAVRHERSLDVGVGIGLVVAGPVGAVVGGVVVAVGDTMALHRPLRSFFNSLSDDLSRGGDEL